MSGLDDNRDKSTLILLTKFVATPIPHVEDYYMLLVTWAYRKIQCLSELCKGKDQYLASLFNHCMERNLKHSRWSMNVWLNKQCTWKM